MEKEAIHDRLSSVVIQFCKDNIPYDDSLSVHGNIIIIADNFTVLTFFSKKVEKDKDRQQPVNTIKIQDLPDRLTSLVVKFCQENVSHKERLSVHGNITTIADDLTVVSFFSKKHPDLKAVEDKDSSEKSLSAHPSPKSDGREDQPEARQDQQHLGQHVFPQWQPSSGSVVVDGGQSSCAQQRPQGMMGPGPGPQQTGHLTGQQHGMGGDYMHQMNSGHYGQQDMMGQCPPQMNQHPGPYGHPGPHMGQHAPPPMSQHNPPMGHSMGHMGHSTSHMDHPNPQMTQPSHISHSMTHMGQSAPLMSQPGLNLTHTMSHPASMGQVSSQMGQQMSQYGQAPQPTTHNRELAPPPPPPKESEVPPPAVASTSKEPVPPTLDDESMSRIAAAEDRGLSYVTSVYTGANKELMKKVDCSWFSKRSRRMDYSDDDTAEPDSPTGPNPFRLNWTMAKGAEEKLTADNPAIRALLSLSAGIKHPEDIKQEPSEGGEKGETDLWSSEAGWPMSLFYNFANSVKASAAAAAAASSEQANKQAAADAGFDSDYERPVDESFECEICQKVMKTKSTFYRHMKSHPDAKQFECDQCHRSFPRDIDLSKHMLNHVEEKSHICKKCDTGFKKVIELKQHMKTHRKKYEKKKKKIKKPRKPREVPDGCTLKTLENGKTVFECKVCQKGLTTPQTLRCHLRLHSGEKPFQCDICKKRFANEPTMVKHKVVHSEKKPYKCEICGREFNDQSTYSRHKYVHSGERPFMCELCGKRFVKAHDLRIHKMTHTGERPYQCDICGKKVSNRYWLADHKRIHTGEKPFICELCGKAFRIAADVKKHIMFIHTGEKPYKCEFCPKAFTDSAGLAKHRRIHTGEKPYKCMICGKAFAHCFLMKKHVASHTEYNTAQQLLRSGPPYRTAPEYKAPEYTNLDYKAPEYKAQEYKAQEYKAQEYKAPSMPATSMPPAANYPWDKHHS